MRTPLCRLYDAYEAPAWLLLALIVSVASVLTLSGFILEYGYGVLPCKMCWWQRYAHWAVGGLALLGLVAVRLGGPLTPGKLRGVAGLLLVPVLAGAGVAAWQFAAQHGWLPFPASCTSDGVAALAQGADLLGALQDTRIVPCDKEDFTLWGLSLAGWNVLVATPVLLGLVGALWGGVRRKA